MFLHGQITQRPKHVRTISSRKFAGWRGVEVTRFIRSTKLFYARPGW